NLHHLSGRISVPAVALLQRLQRNGGEPRSAFRWPGKFPSCDRERHVLAIAEEYVPDHDRLSVLHSRPRQCPGDGADRGFSRQVVRALLYSSAMDRADLLGKHRLVVDL